MSLDSCSCCSSHVLEDLSHSQGGRQGVQPAAFKRASSDLKTKILQHLEDAGDWIPTLQTLVADFIDVLCHWWWSDNLVILKCQNVSKWNHTYLLSYMSFPDRWLYVPITYHYILISCCLGKDIVIVLIYRFGKHLTVTVTNPRMLECCPKIWRLDSWNLSMLAVSPTRIAKGVCGQAATKKDWGPGLQAGTGHLQQVLWFLILRWNTLVTFLIQNKETHTAFVMFEVFKLIIRVAERKIHFGWQNRHKHHFDHITFYGMRSTSRRWILLFTLCKTTAVCSIAKWTESWSGKQTRRATDRQNDQNVKVGKREQLKCARLCLILENSIKPLNACILT